MRRGFQLTCAPHRPQRHGGIARAASLLRLPDRRRSARPERGVLALLRARSDDSFYELSAYQAIRHIRYGATGRPMSSIQTPGFSPTLRMANCSSDLDRSRSGKLRSPWIGNCRWPDWVASIVNAIGQSQFWNSTAIFVTWDDWAVGTTMCFRQDRRDGIRFRVPLLVSPRG